MHKLAADKNRRVLVIDDNRAIHDDFRKILSSATDASAALDASEEAVFGRPTNAIQQTQFEVDSAYQGQDGALLVERALAAGRPYAMAFVDVRMPPGWDGMETTRKLWELDPNLQVVICTAYSDYSWGELFEQLGHRDGLLILKKPFESVEAFQLAHALTEKWWLHRQFLRKVEELESRVAERTQELAKSLSILNATFESTADGVVAVDLAGTVVSYNTKFAAIWKLPANMLARRNAAEMRAYAAEQIKDSDLFLRRTKELQADPEAEGFDVIELKDGRTFERYVFPQWMDHACVGSVINWRDITERKRAENALRESQVNMAAAQSISHFGSWELELTNANDVDANALRWSDEMFRIAGFEPRAVEVSNELFFRLVPPDDRELIRQAVATAIHERRQYSIVHRLIRPDGETRVVHETAQIFFDEQTGRPLKIVGTTQDITEQRKAQEALRESEERFAGAFEHAPIGVALVSPDGHWLQVNRALCELVGYSEPELLTRTFQDITYPEDLETDLEYVRRMIAGEIRFYQMEKRYIHARGHLVSVLLNVSLVRDSQDQPRYFISQIQDITERKQTENALHESNEKFQQLANHITDAFWIRSPDLREVHYISPAFERIWGRSIASLYANPQQWADFILPEDRDRVLSNFASLTGTAPSLDIEYRIVRPDGEIRWVRVRGFQVRDIADKLIRHTGIVTDITERKRVEARLFQSQKMETVGKLAGGIAHEFNSILTAIIGQSELILGDLPPGHPLVRNAAGIHKAAERAATLTRQLLAYGRRTFLRPEALDLNQIIASMEDTIRHLTSASDVDVRIIPAPGLPGVRADAGQIEQVILNLVMNAAAAMPNGGKLTLETGNISFDQESVGRYPDLKPGDFVMLAITDTGTGMSEAVKARAFEPFFSTKGVGQGTGLGLSTCYGIVKQSGGHISVYSELARGTTFKIYLPQIESQTKIPLQRLDSPGLPRGTETILLVEDDPALREMAATLLGRLGYHVLAAANGVEALNLKQQRGTGHIDLLFTDVAMPHMSGKELADRVRVLSPCTRILFASAYTENAMVHQGVLDPDAGSGLLQKPFTPSALAIKLREVLDLPRAPKPDSAPILSGLPTSIGGENTP